MHRKKLLMFLDVDGVLNNHNEIFLIQTRNREEEKKREEEGGASEDCLKNRILDATEYHIAALDKIIEDLDHRCWDTEIVISSCWRYPGCKDWFNDQFKYFGSKVAAGKVIGETIRINGKDVERGRDLEILDFLKKRGSDKYDGFIAIDDDSFDMKKIINNFYHTNGRIGLHKLDSYFICKMVRNLEVCNNIWNRLRHLNMLVEIDYHKNEYQFIDKIEIHAESYKEYCDICCMIQLLHAAKRCKSYDLKIIIWYEDQCKDFYF